jgi:hypothetical protein
MIISKIFKALHSTCLIGCLPLYLYVIVLSGRSGNSGKYLKSSYVYFNEMRDP